ncbi:MAG: hypothetical protein E7678_02715 [Ruminococcaceae bacterium]|nr:hypothetical protein [Oscillospiraceae bacterium]
MKKILYILAFFVVYSILFSFFIECFFCSLGMLLGFSIDTSYDPFGDYPIFLPFCLIMGFVALGLLVLTFIINLKKAENIGYTKMTLACQIVAVVLGTVLLIKPWEMLFDFLIFIC